MKIAMPLLLCLVGLAAPVTTAWAEPPATAAAAAPGAPASAPKGNIDSPSPDGKFAFLGTYGEYDHTFDLIDSTSRKTLQRIGDEDSSQAAWHVLWAPDSNRFALMTRLGHPIQGVDVYVRTADTFQKLDLPDLPEANIPERLKHGHKFPHFANMNWQEATEWKKDGSLVVTVDTMVDGDGHTIEATRTVVLGFDRAGKVRIEKSTIKYKTETD